MSNSIYPDFTNAKHDIKYVKAITLVSDTIRTGGTFVSEDEAEGKVNHNSTEETDGLKPTRHIDGGFPSALYLATQLIDGGTP